MSAEQEVEMLKELFVKMGAGSAQAATMAKQVSKRAGQVSVERGVTRVEAMSYLIELVTKGRAGLSEDTFLGDKPGE